MLHWHKIGLLAAITFALSCLAGCGSGYDDNAPASLAFFSQDITDGTLALHKGDSSLIGVNAFDASGKSLSPNPSCFAWVSEDPAVLLAKTLGSAALISGQSDWFDTFDASAPAPAAEGTIGADAGTGGAPAEEAATPEVAPVTEPAPLVGHEPSTMLNVICGTAEDAPTASVKVAIVLDAAGRWRVNIEGLGEQELTLTQQGRKVSYVGTGTEANGTIFGDQFTLDQAGFILHGAFTSRTDVSGNYSGPAGLTGAWTAHKMD